MLYRLFKSIFKQVIPRVWEVDSRKPKLAFMQLNEAIWAVMQMFNRMGDSQ